MRAAGEPAARFALLGRTSWREPGRQRCIVGRHLLSAAASRTAERPARAPATPIAASRRVASCPGLPLDRRPRHRWSCPCSQPVQRWARSRMRACCQPLAGLRGPTGGRDGSITGSVRGHRSRIHRRAHQPPAVHPSELPDRRRRLRHRGPDQSRRARARRRPGQAQARRHARHREGERARHPRSPQRGGMGDVAGEQADARGIDRRGPDEGQRAVPRPDPEARDVVVGLEGCADLHLPAPQGREVPRRHAVRCRRREVQRRALLQEGRAALLPARQRLHHVALAVPERGEDAGRGHRAVRPRRSPTASSCASSCRAAAAPRCSSARPR